MSDASTQKQKAQEAEVGKIGAAGLEDLVAQSRKQAVVKERVKQLVLSAGKIMEERLAALLEKRLLLTQQFARASGTQKRRLSHFLRETARKPAYLVATMPFRKRACGTELAIGQDIVKVIEQSAACDNYVAALLHLEVAEKDNAMKCALLAEEEKVEQQLERQVTKQNTRESEEGAGADYIAEDAQHNKQGKLSSKFCTKSHTRTESSAPAKVKLCVVWPRPPVDELEVCERELHFGRTGGNRNGAMTVRVRTLGGSMVKVVIGRDETIAKLKQVIAVKTQVPTNLQRLVFRNIELSNNCKVGECMCLVFHMRPIPK